MIASTEHRAKGIIGSGPDTERCTDVEEFLRILHAAGDVFEIRSPNCPDKPGGSFKATASGYFNDPAIAATEIAKLEKLKPQAIYVILNPTRPDLIARSANAIDKRAKATTSDDAISKLQVLFIDIDPIRPSEISSTDNEMEAALRLARYIVQSLSGEGWGPPLLTGMSGNGATVLYPIRLSNTAENVELIRHCLEALDGRFSDAGIVEVDTSVFNPSRPTKVLGTVVRKGSNLKGFEGVEDRPHRRSWFTKPDGRAEVVSRELLERLAAERPGAIEDGLGDHGGGAGPFDIEAFIHTHALNLTEARGWGRGRKWIFKGRSPLCGDHGDDTAAYLIQHESGAISGGCHHNRCSWAWSDLRKHFDPGCYDKRDLSGCDDDDLGNESPRAIAAAGSSPPDRRAENRHPDKVVGFQMKIITSVPRQYLLTHDDWGGEWISLTSKQLSSPKAVNDITIETLDRALQKPVKKKWDVIHARLLEKAVKLPPDPSKHLPSLIAAVIIDYEQRHGTDTEMTPETIVANGKGLSGTGITFIGAGRAVIKLMTLLRTVQGAGLDEVTRDNLIDVLRGVGADNPPIRGGGRRERLWVIEKDGVERLRALAMGEFSPELLEIRGSANPVSGTLRTARNTSEGVFS